MYGVVNELEKLGFKIEDGGDYCFCRKRGVEIYLREYVDGIHCSIEFPMGNKCGFVTYAQSRLNSKEVMGYIQKCYKDRKRKF